MIKGGTSENMYEITKKNYNFGHFDPQVRGLLGLTMEITV